MTLQTRKTKKLKRHGKTKKHFKITLQTKERQEQITSQIVNSQRSSFLFAVLADASTVRDNVNCDFVCLHNSQRVAPVLKPVQIGLKSA